MPLSLPKTSRGFVEAVNVRGQAGEKVGQAGLDNGDHVGPPLRASSVCPSGEEREKQDRVNQDGLDQMFPKKIKAYSWVNSRGLLVAGRQTAVTSRPLRHRWRTCIYGLQQRQGTAQPEGTSRKETEVQRLESG